jgi:hypothetical protein
MRHGWTMLVFAALLALLPGSGRILAQGLSDAVPPNGQARPFGRGWVCKPGFRQDGSACVAVNLPENGYLSDTSYGAGWECRYGYRQDGNLCTAVNLPRDAYLTDSGEYWECERGYRKAEKGCVAISVPKSLLQNWCVVVRARSIAIPRERRRDSACFMVAQAAISPRVWRHGRGPRCRGFDVAAVAAGSGIR